MYQYTYDDISKRYIDMVYRLALARTRSAEDAARICRGDNGGYANIIRGLTKQENMDLLYSLGGE